MHCLRLLTSVSLNFTKTAGTTFSQLATILVAAFGASEANGVGNLKLSSLRTASNASRVSFAA